jgi:hypothetical protein
MVEKTKAIKKVPLSSKLQISCISNSDSDGENTYKIEQRLTLNNGGVENSGPQYYNRDVAMARSHIFISKSRRKC